MPEHTPAPTASRAVYGFAMFLSFQIFFVLYLIWAVVPEQWFKAIGITCLPQRYWAVTIPILAIFVVIIFGLIMYPGMGLYMTPAANDIRTICDSFDANKKKNKTGVTMHNVNTCSCSGNQCFKMSFEKNSGDFVARTIPAVEDINMWEVSDHLYLK